jgi:poly(3-hydroxybutyrate) depolymerase
MLYAMYELQRAALAPMRFAATSALQVMDQPVNLIRETPIGRYTYAALDSFEHTTRIFGKPPFELPFTEIDGQPVEVFEEVVVEKTWGNLLHFKRAVEQPNAPKLLLVAPMSGHYATLLRGTVKEFLPDHDVYITDWHDARDIALFSPGFDLDDYVDYVTEYVKFLGPDVHLIAVCQPAVPVFSAISLMNEREPAAAPRSMTLIGGPIDTRQGITEVNRFAETRGMSWFENNVIHRVPFGNKGFMRRVYPGFLQLAGFMAMNMDRHVDAHWKMFQHLVEGDDESLDAKRAFYTEYRAVMDLSAEFYLQTIRTVFLEHQLPRGLMMHRTQKVDPSHISVTALQTIEGERDDISGVGQTQAAHALASNLSDDKRDHFVQDGVGHYGLFNGKRFSRDIAPRIKSFIAKHR